MHTQGLLRVRADRLHPPPVLPGRAPRTDGMSMAMAAILTVALTLIHTFPCPYPHIVLFFLFPLQYCITNVITLSY